MTKAQLDNLIYFCFNFHETMGVNTDGCSADYILEKWNKYIGVKTYTNDSLRIEVLNEEMKDIRKCRSFGSTPIGIGREDVRRIEALLEWSNKWGIDNYNKIKEILYFILVINSKDFDTEIGQDGWTPTQLIETFGEWVGDVDEIFGISYHNTGLHHNINREINKWLELTNVNRDYKLCSLI